MRLTLDKIEALKNKYNVDTLFSWSKFSLYEKDPYSYLLKYINKVQMDRPDNAYSFLGGVSHDLIEKYYNNEITKEEMIEIFNDNIELQNLSNNLKFSTNAEQNTTIQLNYVSCMRHYFNNCQKETGAKLEQLIWAKLGDHLFHGYIDMLRVDNDNNIIVTDFKTSTVYKGKKIEEEKGQLLLYAIMIHKQFPDILYDKIKVCWNFLKYATLEHQQVNGAIKQTMCLRNELYQKLIPKVKMWMRKFKYNNDEIQSVITKIEEENQLFYIDNDLLNNIPIELRDKFNICDCIVDIPFSENEINHFEREIIEKCDEIEEKTKLYKETNDEHLFWSDVRNENLYYYLNLCSYGVQKHKPLKEFYQELDKMNEEQLSDSDKSVIMDFLFS